MALRIYGNRPLKTLPGQKTRPTSARVREAVFNILQGDVSGCRWLDLCAGSGAMGAEALCRGACYALGIERSGPACAVVSHNWRQVAGPGQTFDVVRGDLVKQLPRLKRPPFDYIYFDPPYASDLYEPALQAIATYALLQQGGALIVEHADDKMLPPEVLSQDNSKDSPQLRRYRQKTYGHTQLSFYAVDCAAAL